MVKILNLPSTASKVGQAFGSGIATGTQQLINTLNQERLQQQRFEQQEELQRQKLAAQQGSALLSPQGIEATRQLLTETGTPAQQIEQILQSGDEQLIRGVLRSRLAPTAFDKFINTVSRRFFGGTSAAPPAPGQEPPQQGGFFDFLNVDPAQQQMQQPPPQTPMQQLQGDITQLSPVSTEAQITQDTNAGPGSAAAAAGMQPFEQPQVIPQQVAPGQVQPELAAAAQQPALAPGQQVGPLARAQDDRNLFVAPGIPTETAQAGLTALTAQQQAQQQPLPEQPGLSEAQNEAISGQPLGPLVDNVLRPLGIARPPTEQEAQKIIAERETEKIRAEAREQLPFRDQILDEMDANPNIRFGPTQRQAFAAQEIGRAALQGLVTLPSLATKLLDIATFGKTPLWQVARFMDKFPGSVIPRTVERPTAESFVDKIDENMVDAATFFTELSTGALTGGVLQNAFRGASGLGAVGRNIGKLFNISPATALKMTGGRQGARALADWYGTDERGKEIAGIIGQLGVSAFEIARGRFGLRNEAGTLFDRVGDAPPSQRIGLQPLKQNISRLGQELETLQGSTGFNQVAPMFEELNSLAQQGEMPISRFAALKRTWNNLGFDQQKSNAVSKFAKNVAGTLRSVTNTAAKTAGPTQGLAQSLQTADAMWTMANQRSSANSLWRSKFSFTSPWRWLTIAASKMMGLPLPIGFSALAAGVEGTALVKAAFNASVFDPTGRSLLSQAMGSLVTGTSREFNERMSRFDRWAGRQAPVVIRNDRGRQQEVAFNLAERIMVPAQRRR